VTVLVLRAGIIAMCVVRSKVRRVTVRGGRTGIVVAQRHA